MKNSWKKITGLFAALVLVMSVIICGVANAEGNIGIGVTPMRNSIILTPGETYEGSFVVLNSGQSDQDLHYHVDIKPFYVDENYNPVFERDEKNDMQYLAEWITVTDGKTGVVAPNDVKEVKYQIKVPEDAPAGGQYAVLSATTDIGSEASEGVNIGEGMAVNHLILAEVAGETVVSGEITDVGLQRFMFGGMINAHSIVKNTGNVHGLATYKLEVYPLFSDEAVYNSEVAPESHYILPNRTLYNESYWKDTPAMGIYNVVYTVEFMGEVSQVTGVVFICPIWLILIIIIGITIVVIRIKSMKKIRNDY